MRRRRAAGSQRRRAAHLRRPPPSTTVVVTVVNEMLVPPLKEEGVTITDVNCRVEDGTYYLRFFRNGVSVDEPLWPEDCRWHVHDYYRRMVEALKGGSR